MAEFTLPFVLLISLLTFTSTAHSRSTPSSFITSSCSITRYPDVCVASLSDYSDKIQKSPKEMAQAALTVSLTKAKSVKAFVTQMYKSKGLKKIEYSVMKDCVETVTDSVDKIRMSVDELGHMGHGEESFMWHMSNVQTWVSAALTDENTCMDGFTERAMDGKLKTAVRSKIVDVAKITSNALALINQFAKRH